MTITHITPREMALEAENARYLNTIRYQARSLEIVTAVLNEARTECDGVNAELHYLRTQHSGPYFQHYQDALGKLAVAKASAEMWKRKAEQVERDSLKMAQETDEIIAFMRLDCKRYEYLMHCDFVAHAKYVKDIDPTTHKKQLRAKHDREIKESK